MVKVRNWICANEEIYYIGFQILRFMPKKNLTQTIFFFIRGQLKGDCSAWLVCLSFSFSSILLALMRTGT